MENLNGSITHTHFSISYEVNTKGFYITSAEGVKKPITSLRAGNTELIRGQDLSEEQQAHIISILKDMFSSEQHAAAFTQSTVTFYTEDSTKVTPNIPNPITLRDETTLRIERALEKADGATYQPPPSKPDKAKLLTADATVYKTKEEWCKAIIEQFKIKENGTASRKTIALNLLADRYNYYCELQKEIAKLIPLESNRPVIDLCLCGSESADQQLSFGIIGGVGCLSDAAILKLTLEKLQQKGVLNRVKINLYSAPPPRTNFEWAQRGIAYRQGLKKFLSRQDISNYCIASNTAHLRLAALQNWSGNKMVNLVNSVVNSLLPEKNKKNILILATLSSHKGKLYPKVLKQQEIACLTLNKKGPDKIQKIINTVKSGKHDAINSARFLKILKEALDHAQEKGEPITHILLGCTELAIALGDESIQKALKNAYGVEIVDSEKIFAETITDFVISTNKRAE